MGLFAALCTMRTHPIPPVTEPLQYRAIGVVRGRYIPNELDHFTRGKVVDSSGVEVEAVILGRVLALLKRHVDLEKPHLWVVYPRSRDFDSLHLQISGIWEPSTLSSEDSKEKDISNGMSDQLQEGDDFFSIRGELIYTKPSARELVIKVRPSNKNPGKSNIPFKIQIKGEIPQSNLRHFISLSVRRNCQELHVEQFEIIAPMSTRGGKRFN
tara:strand:+ start:2323 stop:2958 length:636 start_codon:yes stop_codon:yes gene_type:complete